jgi:hypothetical protein
MPSYRRIHAGGIEVFLKPGLNGWLETWLVRSNTFRSVFILAISAVMDGNVKSITDECGIWQEI